MGQTHTTYSRLQQAATHTAPHMSTENETKLVHVRPHFHLCPHTFCKSEPVDISSGNEPAAFPLEMMSGARALRAAQSRHAGIYPQCLRGEVIMACPTGRTPQGRPERHWRNYSSRLPLTCRLYGWENQRRGLGRGRPGGFAWIAACDPCPGILQKMHNDCCVSAGLVCVFPMNQSRLTLPFLRNLPLCLPGGFLQ